jgi:hypothetical protein
MNVEYEDPFRIVVHDIYLASTTSRHSPESDAEPKYNDYRNMDLQLKHEVINAGRSTIKSDVHVLRINTNFGVRWVEKSTENTTDKHREMAMIEASIVIEIYLPEGLSSADTKNIEVSAMKVATFHSWPYWRELLDSTCARMCLPKVFFQSNPAMNHEQTGYSKNQITH